MVNRLASLDTASSHFEEVAGFRRDLKDKLEEILSRENTYQALLDVGENRLKRHESLRGQNARQVAIDALVVSEHIPEVPTASDYIIGEAVCNYSRLIRNIPQPTETDLNGAALTALGELNKTLYEDLPDRHFTGNEFLSRHFDMYAARRQSS